jgi:hypothetical protein
MDRWTHFEEDIYLYFSGIDAINLEVDFLYKLLQNKEISSVGFRKSVHLSTDGAKGHSQAKERWTDR